MKNTLHLFSKNLRIHDNRPLYESVQKSAQIYPIYILQKSECDPELVGINRFKFLLECLQDLDQSLRKNLNSRLLFFQSDNPKQLIEQLIVRWNIKRICFQKEIDPEFKKVNDEIRDLVEEKYKGQIELEISEHHTLYNLDEMIKVSGNKPPNSMTQLYKTMDKLGLPMQPYEIPENLASKHLLVDQQILSDKQYDIPTLNDFDKLYDLKQLPKTSLCIGGETQGLKRLEQKMANQDWVANFEKPKSSPNSLDPSTTLLSPYVAHGCVSVRLFYYKIREIYNKKKKHTEPPVSLLAQLFWRELFYSNGYGIKNFDQIAGNPICKQIKWDNDPKLLDAWKNARTGYPFIDAILTQLKQEGWIHHLARHAVACFLTRGDLYQSWTEGTKHFNKLLLDHDWALNNANWMWLSCSSFFYKYFRVYSPVEFGKHTDKTGEYIRKWIPQLKNFPDKYIYEPWLAPLATQQYHNCIIGKDYPRPIVDHKIVSKANILKIQASYAEDKIMRQQAGDDLAGSEDEEDNQQKNQKTQKQRSSSSNQKKPTKQEQNVKINQFFIPKQLNTKSQQSVDQNKMEIENTNQIKQNASKKRKAADVAQIQQTDAPFVEKQIKKKSEANTKVTKKK